MKIKQDFITNSSSTSFILSYKNTKVVTKKMVDIIFKEWFYLDCKADEEFKKEVYKRIKKLENDECVMIPFSCNYETFIIKNDDGNIYVETCNNHRWDNLDILKYVDMFENNDEFEKRFNEMIFTNISTGEKISRKDYFQKLRDEYLKGKENENKK